MIGRLDGRANMRREETAKSANRGAEVMRGNISNGNPFLLVLRTYNRVDVDDFRLPSVIIAHDLNQTGRSPTVDYIFRLEDSEKIDSALEVIGSRGKDVEDGI